MNRPPMTRFREVFRRYRKHGVIAAALLAAYALLGFLAVPWFAQRQLVATLGETLRRPVRVEGVTFNPFTLAAEVRGFAIDEADGRPLLSFDRLAANLQASSLFRWAWTFREFRLEGPRVEVIRATDGTLNLAHLAPGSGAAGGAQPVPAEPATGPRLIVGELVIADGAVHVIDRLRATAFETTVGPVNVDMRDLSTLPDDEGQYQLALTTELGSRLQWSGNMRIRPLRSNGRVTGTGPFAALLSRFVQDAVAFTLPEGRVELAFDYTLGVRTDGALFATVESADVALLDVTLQHDAGSAPFLTLPEARIRGGAARWPERTVSVASVSIAGAGLAVVRSEAGELDLLGLGAVTRPGAAGNAPAVADAGGEPLGGWAVDVAELRVADFRASFEDRALRNPATLELADLDLSLRNVSSAPGAQFPYELAARLGAGGDLASSGTVGVLPEVSLAGALNATRVALGAAQPYVSEYARLAIEGGTVDAALDVATSPRQRGRVTGSVSIAAFDLHNAALEERLVGWATLDVTGLALDLTAGTLELSEVLVGAPYLRLLIAEDRTTNFGTLVVDDVTASDTGGSALAAPARVASPQAGAPAQIAMSPAAAPQPFGFTVGRLAIADGSSDFTDLSLPLPFSVLVTKLAGELTALVTSSAEPAKIEVEGQVEDYGLARIEGTLSARSPAESMDLRVLFRNVAMPDLSPYTAEFAGRTIAGGRLNLDLHYAVDDGVLVGRNGIVIADLELGERIESADAVDLPLDLAVALLKGPDGRITIDLPVSGNLEDPQFDIGSVVRGAFGNLIGGLVTSPFRLLGRLIGRESEDFGEIEFEAGEAALTPPEQEKLVNLAEALALRPELAIVVAGVTAPDQDTAALKAARVDQRLDAAVAAIVSDASVLARRRQGVEAVFVAQFPSRPLEPIQAAFMRPADANAAGSAPVLDESAYLAALRDELVAAEPITADDLARLGQARAAAVRDAVAAGGIDAARIELGELAETGPNDAGWIPLALDVADAD